MDEKMPRSTGNPLRWSRLRWPVPVPFHTHGDGGGAEGELWGAPAACCAWAFLGRRLGSRPASCQVGAARDVGATTLLAVAVLVGFEVLVVVVVVAAGAAAVARDRVGAGSRRDSASSRWRVLITPSRDAIWRWSEAIIACSAVGGGGSGWAGPPPPLRSLKRERLRAAPLSMVAGGVPARKGASAAPVAIRTAGRCRRAANWVATPPWSPILLKQADYLRGFTVVLAPGPHMV